MVTEILIVLGAPNSVSGKLSIISKSRLDCCVKLFSPGKLVLCTGGWGEQFNTSKEAHATYAKRYLIQKGIPKDSFLDFALSENTVDDAVKVKEIISHFDKVKLDIITSDYHVKRVKIIFDEILSQYDISFTGATSPLTASELKPIIEHEQKAISLILKNGLYY